MRAITFFGEAMLLIICMPILLVCMVAYYIWDKYDTYKTTKYFKKVKEEK